MLRSGNSGEPSAPCQLCSCLLGPSCASHASGLHPLRFKAGAYRATARAPRPGRPGGRAARARCAARTAATALRRLAPHALALHASQGRRGGREQAAYHGVPLVGIPMYGDQPDNVAKAVHRGFGLLVPAQHLQASRTRWHPAAGS